MKSVTETVSVPVTKKSIRKKEPEVKCNKMKNVESEMEL